MAEKQTKTSFDSMLPGRYAYGLDDIAARANAADKHVGQLASRRCEPWRMCVPPEPDDSDMLLSQVARYDVPFLLAEVNRLTDERNDEQARLIKIDGHLRFMERFMLEGSANSDDFKEGALAAIKSMRDYVPKYEENDP